MEEYQKHGTPRKTAFALGINVEHFYNILSKRRAISGQLLKRLGFKKVVCYERIQKDREAVLAELVAEGEKTGEYDNGK